MCYLMLAVFISAKLILNRPFKRASLIDPTEHAMKRKSKLKLSTLSVSVTIE